MRYSIHNHTFWTKSELCETVFGFHAARLIQEFHLVFISFKLKVDNCVHTIKVTRESSAFVSFACLFCLVLHIPHISLCLSARRSEDGLAAAQQVCQDMSENLRRATQDKQSFDLRTAAELDDLYRTKINLEERLVELIR